MHDGLYSDIPSCKSNIWGNRLHEHYACVVFIIDMHHRDCMVNLISSSLYENPEPIRYWFHWMNTPEKCLHEACISHADRRVPLTQHSSTDKILIHSKCQITVWLSKHICYNICYKHVCAQPQTLHLLHAHVCARHIQNAANIQHMGHTTYKCAAA